MILILFLFDRSKTLQQSPETRGKSGMNICNNKKKLVALTQVSDI